MKKMVNELEEKEFPYYPSKNFTLKGSKNQFPSLQINKYNNLSEMNNNKVSFQNIHSYNIQNNDNILKYNFGKIGENFGINYISYNERRDKIKVNLN